MITIALGVGLGLLAMEPPAIAAAKSCGFTDAEIERVLRGEVLTKPLKEGSDEELAGVAAVWLATPVAEFADVMLEGRLLERDPSIRSLRVWRPGEDVELGMLDGRYEAYRRTGLKGAGKPGELLTLAIGETELLARVPGYERALLEFPSGSLPGMEHRFFTYEQEVERGSTLVLSHRAAVRKEHEALITEQRYYVSRVYDCRFTVSDGFEMRGGTLLIFVTRLFTDRVAGVGSTLKHALGRRRMLADVAAKLKQAREESSGGGQRGSALSMDHECEQDPIGTRRCRDADDCP